MQTVTIILSGILMLALLGIMAPGILALNRGRALRNIAIWLAIIAALGLYYYNFGPGKNAAMQGAPAAEVPGSTAAPPAVDRNNGDQGFTPPKD
ncbi:MAG: hypothetical protein AB7H77_07150 [Bdellovibrionales bacterium]